MTADKTFKEFSRSALDATAAHASMRSFHVGDTVIREGAEDDLFYIVKSGDYIARVSSRGCEPVATYQAGGTFGELALRYGSPRKATVTCEAAGVLWCIHRATFASMRPG